jgi:5-methylcytosine-specific restriction endonuclease McrA
MSNPNFTRFNVFLRDKFSCQYCGSKKELTFDHLLPRSKGGKTNWDNVVTACSSCNVKKGGRLLSKSGMTLNIMPYQPSTEDLHRNGKNFPPNFLHKSWMDYLYWDVELEP